MLLHIEIEPAVVSEAHNALAGLGYELQAPFDLKGPQQCPERFEACAVLGIERSDFAQC